MRTELQRERSDCYKLLLNTEGKKEETLELVVPDRCGDIGRILDVRGQLFLTSKRVKEGEALVCSQAEVCVLFAAEGSGEPEFVSAQLQIDQSFALPSCPEDSELLAQVRLCAVDARTLNPRKLLLRAEVMASVRVLAQDSFSLGRGFHEEEGSGAYLKRQELTHSLITGFREKSFSISDEYSLSAKYEGSKLLSAETGICVYDTKPVGGKVVFKANAETTALFLNPEDDSLFTCVFTTQFSQIIEVDAAENAQTLIFTALKEAEFISLPERETPCISARFNICAQALCLRDVYSDYVSDAYSCRCDTELECVTVPFERVIAVQKLRIPLKGRLPAPYMEESLVYLALGGVCCRVEGNRVICTAELSGIGEGEECSLAPVRMTLSAEECMELSPGAYPELIAVCCEPASIQQGEVSVAVTAEVCVKERGEIRAVDAVCFGEECDCKAERPSVTVLVAPCGCDTWTLAKKYRSTEELIIGANSLGGDFDLNRRPLLIPRA